VTLHNKGKRITRSCVIEKEESSWHTASGSLSEKEEKKEAPLRGGRRRWRTRENTNRKDVHLSARTSHRLKENVLGRGVCSNAQTHREGEGGKHTPKGAK